MKRLSIPNRFFAMSAVITFVAAAPLIASSFTSKYRTDDTEITAALGLGEGVYTQVGDMDRDGIVSESENLTGDGSRQLFNLSHRFIQRLTGVSIDGNALDFTDFAYDPHGGWVLFKRIPANGAAITINYEWSNKTDILLLTDAPSFNPGDCTIGQCYIALFQYASLTNFPDSVLDVDSGGVDFQVADLNLDGWMDVVSIDGTSIKIGIYDTISSFNIQTITPAGYTLTDIDVGDIDGDGDLDIVAANSDGVQFRYFINDGTTFSEYTVDSSFTYPADGWATHIELADVDNDGDLDMAVGTEGGTMIPHLILNEGQSFVFTMQDAVSAYTKRFNEPNNIIGNPEGLAGIQGGMASVGDGTVFEVPNTNMVARRSMTNLFTSLDSTSPVTTESFKDLAFDAAANQLFVTDTNNNTVIRFDASNLASGPKMVSPAMPYPSYGIATDGTQIYATLDSAVAGQDGVFAWNDYSFSSSQSHTDGALTSPRGIDAYVDGGVTYILWTDIGTNMLYKANANDYLSAGTILTSFGGAGSGNYQFNTPIDVKVKGSYVYVSDAGNDRFQVYRKSDLSYVETIDLTASCPGCQPYYFDIENKPQFGTDIIPASIATVNMTDSKFADLNDDGILDWIIENNSGGSGTTTEQVWKGDGGGVYTTKVIDISGADDIDGGRIGWGDYDNDGDLDLAFGDASFGMGFKMVATYKNPGSWAFTKDYVAANDPAVTTAGTDESTLNDVHLVDLNGDGFLEMLGASNFINGPWGGIAVWTAGTVSGIKVTEVTSTFTSKASGRQMIMVATYRTNPSTNEIGDLISLEVK